MVAQWLAPTARSPRFNNTGLSVWRSPDVGVDFLQVLWSPPTVQRHDAKPQKKGP